MKSKHVVMALVLALAMGLALASYAGQNAAPAVSNPKVCTDKDLCAESLRYGQQAFDRGLYADAKQYFKQAVMADPTSATAWAYYDLCVMYDVADQVKQAGKVQVSGAPAPGSGGSTVSEGSAPPPPPKPAPVVPSGGIVIDDEGC